MLRIRNCQIIGNLRMEWVSDTEGMLIDPITFLWEDETGRQEATAEPGFIFDGNSVPRLLQVFFPRWGRARIGSLIHDLAFMTRFKLAGDRVVSRKYADQVYWAFMLATGVPRPQAFCQRYGVRWFGSPTWNKHDQEFRNVSRISGLILLLGCLLPAAAHAACTTPRDDLFVNPFRAASAHHRPIGTGAEYAPADHPSTQSWLLANGFAINTGAPWGVSVAQTVAGDPLTTIAAGLKICDKVVGLPKTIPLPAGGFVTKVKLNAGGCTDGVSVVYDAPSRTPHQLRQYNWNAGKPYAGQYKTWDIAGLGHGTKRGDRLGTSASGVAALFGILRGDEINLPGRKVEHALQMVIPSAPKHCAMMGSREIVLPAVSGDGYMNNAGYNLGNIPYGALMALPPLEKGGPDIAKLGLTDRGRRIVEAVRDYGIYSVDTGNCVAIRADQYVRNPDELRAALGKVYKSLRMVLNNDVLGTPVAGGGDPIAENCAFDAGTPAPKPVAGQCGPAAGVAVIDPPKADLCTYGAASDVTGAGPWAWACLGKYGGTDALCDAPLLPPIAGACGPAAGIATATPPKDGLCAAGAPGDVRGAGPWAWTCAGANKGTDALCGAPLLPPADVPLRIDAGSTEDVAVGGTVWLADRYVIGGQATDRGEIEIAGTDAPRLYQTERYKATGYDIPLRPGLYEVRLHFAETYSPAAGIRKFGVDVEGRVIDPIDVAGEAGGAYTALIKTTGPIAITDGVLTIRFLGKGPIVNAVEVLPAVKAERGRPRVAHGTVVTDIGTLIRGATSKVETTNYITAAYAREVAALGVNAFRSGYKTRLINRTVEQQLPLMDQAVDATAQAGMYLMLANNIAPGGYDLAGLKEFWSIVAPRYKDRAHVFFEMTNEPVSGPAPWGQAKNWTDATLADLASVYEIMRAGAPDTHIVLFSSANLYPDCQSFADMIARFPAAVDWSKASVGFHHYNGTAQFGEAGLICLRAKYPLLMTETNYWTTDTNGQFRDALDLYERLGISWFSMDGWGHCDRLRKDIIPRLAEHGYSWPVEFPMQ